MIIMTTTTMTTMMTTTTRTVSSDPSEGPSISCYDYENNDKNFAISGTTTTSITSMSLEQTIDSMSESMGCFNLTHYHSFQGVSSLLPLRSCAGCGQRLQISVFAGNSILSSSASNQVVQCMACGAFAHRSCGFSKHTNWKEPCPVNFPSIKSKEKTEIEKSQSENENEEESNKKNEIDNSQQQQNDDYEQKAENNLDESPKEIEEEEEKEDTTIEKETERQPNSPVRSSVWRLTSLSGWFQEGTNNEVIHDAKKTVYDSDMETTIKKASNEEITVMFQDDSKNDQIFRKRPPTAADPASQNDIHAESQATQYLQIRTAASEDGLLHGDRMKRSKANFPFLSASSLLPSNQPHAFGLRSNHILEGNNDMDSNEFSIKRSQTWDAPGEEYQHQEQPNEQIKQQNETIESHDDITKQQPNEQIKQQNESVRSHDDITKQSPGDLFGTEIDSANSERDKLEAFFEWTENGPPAHWATQQLLEKITSSSRIRKDTKVHEEEKSQGPNTGSALHFTSHPFASVSRALQENIIENFRPVVSRYLNSDGSDLGKSHAANSNENDQATATVDPKPSDNAPAESGNSKISEVEGAHESGMETLLEETKPKDDRSRTQMRLGLATVAGGIAGGVVGLAFAGPVGGAIGAKAGQTAGILGVLWEGSVTVGVVASGVAAGRYTGQQLQEKLEEKRVLALGEDGKKRVLLIRPTVTTDPVWSEIYAKERQSFSRSISFSLLPSGAGAAKRERYEREVDIVKTDEGEIPTEDKVLLLVSRILNNKESLPGHVYRCLLQRLMERSEQRGSVQTIFKNIRNNNNQQSDAGGGNMEEAMDLGRARRQDAHAVIKYVTATLLEVRPGFGVSAAITELTASAVEALVFGEIYGLIIEEIEADYEEQDNTLLEKIADFERLQANLGIEGERYKNSVSESALAALHQLPQAHSAVDKLRFCVQFLEKISDFFSTHVDNNKRAMGADSLLKMVCQHILVAKVFAINSQIAFLEEFARDEQLLRGKEGYALVTLQASLHFLNASTDFEKDIFGSEDEGY